MAGMFVPDDYDPNTDGTTFIVAEIPNSTLWLASFFGAVSALTKTYYWDKTTGDRDAAAEIGQDIFDSLSGVIDGGGA